MPLAISTAQPNRSWQFRLADLLFVTLLNGVLCALILPVFFTEYHSADPGTPYPNIGIVTRSISVFVILAGTVALWLSAGGVVLVGNRANWPRAKKWVSAGVLGLGMGIALPASPGMLRAFAKLFDNGISHGDEMPGFGGIRMYCTAQDIYHRADYNHDGILEYAMSIEGTYGLTDTNIWLISRNLAAAFYGDGRKGRFTGYVYKALKGQGPHAMGGRCSYISIDSSGKEHQTGGYALVAAPAVYGPGYFKYTFLVDHHGVVYAADFGNKTPEVFKSMTEFDPDPAVWEVAP